MLLSCSQAADTSNPIFPGIRVVSSIMFMHIFKRKSCCSFFQKWEQPSHLCIKIYAIFVDILKMCFTMYSMRMERFTCIKVNLK